MLVDWRLGERYFKSVLSDYAKGSNLGNWMWVSGAGFNTRLTDVLSPELQARIIDPQKTLRAKFLKDRAKMAPEFEYQETKALWLKKVL
jgi:deoxyribodipyrimidine photo-lyase